MNDPLDRCYIYITMWNARLEFIVESLGSLLPTWLTQVRPVGAKMLVSFGRSAGIPCGL